MLILVEALGYKREDVLTFSDKENNMPLHCAVNSGDILVSFGLTVRKPGFGVSDKVIFKTSLLSYRDQLEN